VVAKWPRGGVSSYWWQWLGLPGASGRELQSLPENDHGGAESLFGRAGWWSPNGHGVVPAPPGGSGSVCPEFLDENCGCCREMTMLVPSRGSGVPVVVTKRPRGGDQVANSDWWQRLGPPGASGRELQSLPGNDHGGAESLFGRAGWWSPNGHGVVSALTGCSGSVCREFLDGNCGRCRENDHGGAESLFGRAGWWSPNGHGVVTRSPTPTGGSGSGRPELLDENYSHCRKTTTAVPSRCSGGLAGGHQTATPGQAQSPSAAR
jgi:hypothetical protein